MSDDSEILDGPVTESGCNSQLSKLTALQERAEKDGKQFEEEGKDLADGDDLSLKFEVEWETVDVRFHVPKVSWSSKDIKFNVPKTYKKTVDASFDVPHVSWENKVIGSYPKCSGFPPRCHKADIVTKVPVVGKRRKEIKFDVPEIKWDTTSISVQYPEFSRSEVSWSFDVPRFRLKEIHVGGTPVYDPERKEKSVALEKKAQDFAAVLEADLAKATFELNECFIGQLLLQRETIDGQFRQAISFLEGSLNAMKAEGAEAPVFQDSEGNTIDLSQQLKDLQDEHAKALEMIDKQIAELAENAGSSAMGSAGF